MADRPLLIALLWHQHQPDYLDPVTGVRHLPWARMHALKSYLSMAERLLRHQVRVTINLTPSLLRGLEEYLRGGTDEFLVHARKPLDALTPHERWFILDNFVRVGRRVVEAFPRYRELTERAAAALSSADPLRAAGRFPAGDLQDLRVWFDLAWFHHSQRGPGTLVGELTARGRGFTAADHEALLAYQLEVIAGVVPAHGQALAAGRVELSTSPLYHPILPLLIDTDVAARASPGLPLPTRFAHPEDALNQIRLGRETFQRVMGVRPQGMWPSEGAVSPATVKLAAACGVGWLGSDEGVLAASLGEGFHRDAIYHPYEYAGTGLLFRDRGLSDLIGFEYHRWPDPVAAARDFVARLRSVRRAHPEAEVVPVFLDGENAWEHYPLDGDSFLDTLYAELAAAPDLATVSVGEALARLRRRELGELAAGSWIGANFETWIGEEEENRAWEYLGRVRQDLAAATPGLAPETHAAAWDALYAAEGSDYFWWFGEDQDSGRDAEYCRDFRAHLARVYATLGRAGPAFLADPIVLPRPADGRPRHAISPVINGRVDSPYEWLGAGRVLTVSGGAMARAGGGRGEVFYGWDRERLYLRVDGVGPVRVELDLPGTGRTRLEFAGSGGEGGRLPGLVAARESVLELALPWAALGRPAGGELGLVVETPWGTARLGVTAPGAD